MNWLDSAIGLISPEWGYKRTAWRQNLDEMRNYDAGDNGRLNRGWRAVNDSAEATDRYSRDTVRARARDLERNSDMMNSVISAFKRNVTGGGYNLQSKTSKPELNKQLEKYWKIWCKKRNCDVTDTQNFNEILRMAVRRKKIDGGILLHKVYTDGGLLPFKLQCLEVDELDISQIVPKHKGNKVVGGIELNQYNKAIGYWIKQYGLDGFSIQMPTFIQAKDIIFYYTKTRPSQVREMSDMCQTIPRIRDVNEFMTAVSVKERIAACLAVFIKKQTPSSVMPGRNNNQTDKLSYDGKMLTPGMMQQLNPGDEIQVVTPNGQATDATTYTKLQQRMIGAGQGISYEATARDMSETNYASARQSLIEDDLTYAEEKEQMQDILDEIYETFVISCVLGGLVNIPDFWGNKEEYLAHEWIQAPKRWIDPLKESNANKTALNTLQKTFKQISAEGGKDWQEQLDDMAEVMEYAKSLNLDLGGILYGGTEQKNGDKEPTGAKEPTDTKK